jgi:hypothetical protein
MNLIIDAGLTEPPSEIAVFRDITLYSNVFLEHHILLECMSDMKDMYWYWLKHRGAFDYVDDFIERGQEQGITIRPERANISVKYLRVETLNKVISRLRAIS